MKNLLKKIIRNSMNANAEQAKDRKDTFVYYNS